ncbi:hypothetical protein A3H10_04610 [Candidatus Uhrbacteria bacterium RIFCSPLOWO2_12_FULL_46_10]|uniref:Uncharacterized protein n=1 Tax=Candidatus Uhrbacteria bacterium RIFCSPLOWO2_01_FULL_47_25 TaxID=1802402 RepID=A0A1F7UW26_9BACT|nr:MAG: hypothetical protein UX68_C0006G0027 [Parcubacteria group bacterium GW2011_GWA2_46_9]OGL59379.1 MAG: hypothetical protein A2752_05475 [Candidatus Uhrbacteria bacterium RIFCSPHIGHO2_01_FULL_46_23]OGL76353.1 MAG: hypothetical protein A3E96_01290 [Candidatus Uhrbacteria bacterium RIFCSPHIGHO2_12_FULL_46_13]OGL82475.1 MAG: hypothetical protein A2936_02350 [Candidatus Uhrbacteria bacterium RIFCSPLOWO2_01_FULL_47_25]OGL85909.1 MAG: hypothetical protein A3I37_00955 [Candidatus Uhrbacteria bact
MKTPKEGHFYSQYHNDARRFADELSDMRQRIDLIATSITNLSREMRELKKVPHSQELMDGKIATMRELLAELEELQKSDEVQQGLIQELNELHKRGIAAIVNLDTYKGKES